MSCLRPAEGGGPGVFIVEFIGGLFQLCLKQGTNVNPKPSWVVYAVAGVSSTLVKASREVGGPHSRARKGAERGLVNVDIKIVRMSSCLSGLSRPGTHTSQFSIPIFTSFLTPSVIPLCILRLYRIYHTSSYSPHNNNSESHIQLSGFYASIIHNEVLNISHPPSRRHGISTSESVLPFLQSICHTPTPTRTYSYIHIYI